MGSGQTTLFVDGGELKVDGDIYSDAVIVTDVQVYTRLNVTGFSTLGDGSGADLIDINARVDVDGQLIVSGITTLGFLWWYYNHWWRPVCWW